MELQDQIYLISGILGGACFLLIVCVGIMGFYLYNLNEQVNGSKKSKQKRKGKEDNYAYNNPQILPGEELAKKGYSMSSQPRQQQPWFTRSESGNFSGAPVPNQMQQQQPPQQQQRYPPQQPAQNRQIPRQHTDHSIDAQRDFAQILKNDDVVFGGSPNKFPSNDFNSKKAGGNVKNSSYNDNITYANNNRGGYDDRQSLPSVSGRSGNDKNFFNNRAMDY